MLVAYVLLDLYCAQRSRPRRFSNGFSWMGRAAGMKRAYRDIKAGDVIHIAHVNGKRGHLLYY